MSALKSGTVSSPKAFLLDVDQSQWCAPSTNGIPCYAGQILGGDATVTDAQIARESGSLENALTIYSDTNTVLRSYAQRVSEAASDQSVLAALTQQLATATDETALADWELSTATRVLRQSVLYDYTNSGRLDANDDNLQMFEPSSETGVVARDSAKSPPPP